MESVTSEAVISVSDLRMQYGDVEVLTGLDFTVEAGEVLAVLGPNGAGKTTTVEILEGFRARSAGEVTVLGTDPAHGDEWWRAQIGVVLQNWSDHGRWKPREFLSYLAALYRPYEEPRDPDELLELVGLADKAGDRIQKLSGGQRRRLDVAAAIIGRPGVLFLDEPTTGFDPHARRQFHELIHRLADFDGTTIVLTTHDLAEAEKLASRILILAGGRIIADGSPDTLARAASNIGEVRWTQRGERHVHSSEDATEFVRELLATDGGTVSELVIHQASLEDSYLTLVERFEAGEADAAVAEFAESTSTSTDSEAATEGVN